MNPQTKSKHTLRWSHAVALFSAAGFTTLLAQAPAGDIRMNNAVNALRDPTQAGAGLQAVLQGGGGGVGGVPIGRLLKIEVVGLGTNATPAEVEMYRAAKPAERMIRLIDVNTVSFAEVARTLSRMTGLNVAPTATAGTNSVSLFLSNLPVQSVLETMCTANGLWLREDEKTGIVRVYTVGEFRRDLASFRDEQTEIFTLLYPNSFDIANAISDLFGERVEVSTGDNDMESMMELQQRMARFDILDQRATGLGMAANGQSSGGGGFGGGMNGGGFGGMGGMGMAGGMGGMGMAGGMGFGGFGMGGMMGNQGQQRRQQTTLAQQQQMLTNPNLNAEQVQALSDAQQNGEVGNAVQQVDQALGRRVTIHVTVLRRQNKLLVRTADENALKDIRNLVAKLDVPQSMVLLDVRVLRVSLGDGFNSAFDYSFLKGVGDGQLNGAFSPSEILPPASVTSGVTPNFNPGGGVDAQAMVFQYLGQNVRARMQLLETKGRLNAVASPVLLTANNEVSRVFVGEEVPITRGFSGAATIPTGGNGGAIAQAANAQLEFRPVGTTLLLTPNINADRTVTLRLVQENSSLRRNGATIPVPTEGGGFRSQAVDTVQSRTVSGTFIAQHEQAVVVGGLIEESETVDRSGIPILSSIPYLGAPFRKDTKAKVRSELVVIIRPFIVNTPKDAEAISQRVTRELSLNPAAWKMGDSSIGLYTTNDVVNPDPAKARKANREAQKNAPKAKP
jgi:general secretion pathway protein D